MLHDTIGTLEVDRRSGRALSKNKRGRTVASPERAARVGNQDLFDSWILIVSAIAGASLPLPSVNRLPQQTCGCNDEKRDPFLLAGSYIGESLGQFFQFRQICPKAENETVCALPRG